MCSFAAISKYMNKGLQLTFVTPYGLQPNEYANEVVQQIMLDDLFLPDRE